MLAVLKQKLRTIGWRETAPDELRRFCRYRSEVYDPATALREWAAMEGETVEALRWELRATDPYRFSEYVYEIDEPVTVEPLHGIVVRPGLRLARSLLAVHESVPVPPPHLLQYRRALAQARLVEKAVLLRHHYGESNYFHFYNDVLSMLPVLERFPKYADWPLLVSRVQFEMPFFQGAIARAGWRDREWIVQESGAIKVERLVVAKGLGLTRAFIEFLWRWLKVPVARADSARRLYVRRGSGTARPLLNQEEVERACVRHGFESVDTGRLSLDEQIALFSEARFIVAEHGAGSTNLMFRRGQRLSYLELMPPGYISTCYFVICHRMGFAHDALSGEPGSGAGGFTIDVPKFETRLQAMLDAKPTERGSESA